MQSPLRLALSIVFFTALTALELTLTNREARGCSAGGSGPGGNGGQGGCTQQEILDLVPAYPFIPADGVLVYRAVLQEVPCGAPASPKPAIRVVDPDGVEVVGSEATQPVFEGAFIWKPETVFQPQTKYQMIVDGLPDSPLTHPFATGNQAPAPQAVLQVDPLKVEFKDGLEQVQCRWFQQLSGGCLQGYAYEQFAVSQRQQMVLRASAKISKTFADFYDYQVRWDGQPGERLTPLSPSYIHVGETLPGACISLRVRNLVTGAEDTSEPVCLEPPGLQPDTLDCGLLASVVQRCGQAGAPNTSPGSGVFDKGEVVTDVSTLQAACQAGAGGASSGTAGASTSGGSSGTGGSAAGITGNMAATGSAGMGGQAGASEAASGGAGAKEPAMPSEGSGCGVVGRRAGGWGWMLAAAALYGASGRRQVRGRRGVAGRDFAGDVGAGMV